MIHASNSWGIKEPPFHNQSIWCYVSMYSIWFNEYQSFNQSTALDSQCSMPAIHEEQKSHHCIMCLFDAMYPCIPFEFINVKLCQTLFFRPPFDLWPAIAICFTMPRNSAAPWNMILTTWVHPAPVTLGESSGAASQLDRLWPNQSWRMWMSLDSRMWVRNC